MLKMVENHKYILECSCGNPSHLCIFHHYKDEDPHFNSLDIYFTSNYHLGFFQRLKLGLKFIFLRHNYNISDSVILNKEGIEKLEQFIKEYKETIV